MLCLPRQLQVRWMDNKEKDQELGDTHVCVHVCALHLFLYLS